MSALPLFHGLHGVCLLFLCSPWVLRVLALGSLVEVPIKQSTSLPNSSLNIPQIVWLLSLVCGSAVGQPCAYLISFNFSWLGGYYFHPHFTNGEVKKWGNY